MAAIPISSSSTCKTGLGRAKLSHTLQCCEPALLGDFEILFSVAAENDTVTVQCDLLKGSGQVAVADCKFNKQGRPNLAINARTNECPQS